MAKGGVEDEATSELEKLGAPLELIEEMREASRRDNDFDLWEENWPVVRAFLRVRTQWIVAPMGGFVGLNYQSVEFTLKLYKDKNRQEIFEGLQIMEHEILDALREESKK